MKDVNFKKKTLHRRSQFDEKNEDITIVETQEQTGSTKKKFSNIRQNEESVCTYKFDVKVNSNS